MVDMMDGERRGAYASLWLFALAFGWIEASVVVYLREIAMRERALQTTAYLPNFQVPLVSLPATLVALEMAREACTLVLLGTAAWLAGRRVADRIGAFLLAFGIWDITYYAGLRLVSGWPEGLSTWDILFLIPSPWVAPVWAPVTIATLFVIGGTYLFWTANRTRRYRWTDIGVLLAAAGLTFAAFLAGSNAVIDHRLPERFPLWVFWSGVILGVVWFARVERREAQGREDKRPWVGVRVRTLAPTHPGTPSMIRSAQSVGGVIEEPQEEHDLDRVVARYRDATNRLNSLVDEASELAERLERLAHGLSTRPGHLVIGLPDESAENPSEWDIVPSHPLPSIEQLAALTDNIRAERARVEELRERLILMGHAELVEQRNGFFQ
jgi:hypothetical protein